MICIASANVIGDEIDHHHDDDHYDDHRDHHVMSHYCDDDRCYCC
jgi:hypothetical protein